MIERLSIELTQRCQKACWFCYSESGPDAPTSWTVDDVAGFALDSAAHGVRAVSFGGGEPREFDGVFEVLRRLQGHVFRSLTTNGLRLDDLLDELLAAQPDKVHISIHFPANRAEVERVHRQVTELSARGVASGINLLVSRAGVDAAARAAGWLRENGVGNDRIVYLPMRMMDTPTPAQMGRVAGSTRFQSMSCLLACGRSPRFAAIGWDRSAAWCSYTTRRRLLLQPNFSALVAALDGLGLDFCGGTNEELVRLSRRPQHGHDVVRGGP